MTARIFIDGEAGTTGLQIRELLANRSDIKINSLLDHERKDLDARKRALNNCDLAILCLPDEAAKESVSLIQNTRVRVVDASTSHRTSDNWVYGFPEMLKNHSETIASSNRVSNPGCYPTGAIAMIRPLMDAGVLGSSQSIMINAISGYSGGGKNLIERFESVSTKDSKPAFYLYGTDLSHKHLPEMKKHMCLDHSPIFAPSVGRFYQGMLVQIPLPLWSVTGNVNAKRLHAILADHYQDSKFVSVNTLQEAKLISELDPESLNKTNNLKITIFENSKNQHCLITAVLDNLGKGASGAAIQSMDLMLGLNPTYY
jgi:N-acetyl-gamma-glutamyl-phosphate reductase